MNLIYTIIQHQPRKKRNISLNEYALCDMVYHLSNNQRYNWCISTKENIAIQLGLTKQTILSLIEKMINKGFIIKDDKTKFLKTTNLWYDEFVIYTDSKETLLEVKSSIDEVKKIDQPGKENGPTLVKKIDQPGKETLPNNIYNNNINNNKIKKNINIYDSDFDLFWSLYPNKKEKPKTYQKYISLREKKINHQDIIDGLYRYKRQIEITKTETKYIKHPTTRLNNECWNDEYNIGIHPKPKPKPINYVELNKVEIDNDPFGDILN